MALGATRFVATALDMAIDLFLSSLKQSSHILLYFVKLALEASSLCQRPFSGKRVLGDVRDGSNSTDLRCPRNVSSSPDSGRIAALPRTVELGQYRSSRIESIGR